MKNPPGLKIFDQPQQIPMQSAKKITQNFFRKKILIFNAAILHLKFYYICIVVNSIVDLGQLILEANAPTSSWNFLMIFTFLESLHTIFIIRFSFWRDLINFTVDLFWHFFGSFGDKMTKSKIDQIVSKLKSYYKYGM